MVLLVFMSFCIHAVLLEPVTISSYIDDIPFEHAYPKHLRARKVSEKEQIVIDGKLDEKTWTSAMWMGDFVDIIRHKIKKLNKVPSEFQSEVAVMWNDTFLFVGAKIKEPFIYGAIEGHNKEAPYHDNDFEVFVDVSGTNYYYKEFEINALNATYDVNWGVPDNAKLKCDSSEERLKPYLPVCVNTSFHGYAGSWTMKSKNGGSEGLLTATQYKKKDFAKFGAGNEWTIEMAFPIKSSASHGGLLDTDGDDSVDYSKYHPSLSSSKSPVPHYWWIDFARAEHPREYSHEVLPSNFCPFRCWSNLTSYSPSKDNPDGSQCKQLQTLYTTLLGSDPTYGCYFEWVFQDIGRRDAYMHRPQEWAILEFSDASENCYNIEFLGRHALKLIYYAQVKYKSIHGTYTNDTQVLTKKKYCTYKQDCQDLVTLNARRDIFTGVQIDVVANATVLSAKCTSRPCFTATLYVLFFEPIEMMINYVASINENMHVTVKHNSKVPGHICL